MPGSEDALARRPQLARERAGLHGEDGARGGGAHELGILDEHRVDHEGGQRRGPAVGRHPRATRARRRRDQLPVLGLPVLLGERIPVPDLQVRIVQRRGHAVAPLRGRRSCREPVDQCPQGAGGEQLRLQERDEEAERQQHPAAEQHPPERLEARGVDAERLAREVVHEEHGEEEQGRRGDREQGPPLRMCRGAEPHRVHDADADGHRESEVGLRLADPQDHVRRDGAHLEHVGGTRGYAACERPTADEGGRQERPEAEEDEQREAERGHEHPLGEGGQPSRREGEEQVERREGQRALDQDAEVEEQRRVGRLPRVDPGDRAERHEQGPEPARRAPQPPVQPDQQEGGDEIGGVGGRRHGMADVVARHAEPERRRRHDRGRAHDGDRDRTRPRVRVRAAKGDGSLDRNRAGDTRSDRGDGTHRTGEPPGCARRDSSMHAPLAQGGAHPTRAGGVRPPPATVAAPACRPAGCFTPTR